MQQSQRSRQTPRVQAQRLRQLRPRERSRVSWKRRLSIIALITVTVLVVTVVLAWQRAVALNDAVSNQPALSMRLFGPFSPERVNVLLLGYSDESRDGAYLSDSMNVLSVDNSTGSTTMIPIPRDLWVEGVEEVPQNMKINEALRIGVYAGGLENGAELAAEAVEHVTGLHIDGWVTIDFQGFQTMVDAIGGVTLENPTAFRYTWDEPDYLAGNFPYAFDAGTLHLDGQHALDYARNRYTDVASESSDFARLVRQQRVLQAIRGAISGWGSLPKAIALAESLAGHLHTNLSVLDLGMLAGHLSPERRIEMSEGVILEATTNTIGQYVLAVIGRRSSTDYEPLHAFIAAAMADVTPQSPTPGP